MSFIWVSVTLNTTTAEQNGMATKSIQHWCLKWQNFSSWWYTQGH